ncbi:MAG: caiD [Gammaproteobacteria bacterium]|nr:caiD [Gammaproteobacteria bacterium]
MGGGVGISIHGRHRVATETLRFAMPECAIGFFPDVGGSYFLSRAPGKLGTYLGLSGVSIQAADALYCGFIDHCIAATSYTAMKTQLLNTDFSKATDANKIIANILKQYAVKIEESALAAHREQIDQHFQGDSVVEIIRSLQQDAPPWCQELALSLQQKSPLSLKVTLEQLRRGKTLSLDACLKMEYNIAQHFAVDKDFYEGVRAQIIDKDKTPHWQPATLAEVSDKAVAAYFDVIPTTDLNLL